MPIVFAVEPWQAIIPELKEHLYAHWREVALDQDEITLDPDWDAYATMDRQGMVHVVTGREEGHLVAYAVVICRRHLHYQQSLSGSVDVYYLAPAHRKGLAGYRLLHFMQQSLRDKGVQRLFSGTKSYKKELDMSPLFTRLGWRHTEELFTLML